MADRCPTCRTVDPQPGHVDQCAEVYAASRRVIDRAAAESIPEVTAADLWAHLRRRVGGHDQAAAAALVVIDLGWRPVIGDQHLVWSALGDADDQHDGREVRHA